MTDDNEDVKPKFYEKKEFVKDERLHWIGNLIILLLVVLIIGFLGFWNRLNTIYNGNPQSGGRELLCALAVDDALTNPEVMKSFDAHCSEFRELLDE